MAEAIPSRILRDTLFIWVFATARKKILDEITNGPISGDVLHEMLVAEQCIKAGDTDNRVTCDEVCKKIRANPDEFATIQEAWAKIPILFEFWHGSEVHPQAKELKDIFIPV